MSRIENNVGTQIGDLVRPVQAEQDRRHQDAEVLRQAHSDPEAAASRPSGPDELREVLAAVQEVVETATGKALQFSLDEGTEDLVVTVTDRHSEEIIRQIPSEEVLRLRERMRDLVGLLIDQTA